MENEVKNDKPEISFSGIDTNVVMQTAYGDPIPEKRISQGNFIMGIIIGIILPIILIIIGGRTLIRRQANKKKWIFITIALITVILIIGLSVVIYVMHNYSIFVNL